VRRVPHRAGGHERLEERVVVRELDDGRRARQVHAAVARVRDERAVAKEQRDVERRPHAGRLLPRFGFGAHGVVGALEDAAQEGEHRVARLERRILGELVEDAPRFFLTHHRGDGLQREPRRYLARRVPAHPVRHAEEREVGQHGERVLVVLADFADVGGSRVVDAEIETRDGTRHSSSYTGSSRQRNCRNG
jgi:hypothetical protein